MNQALTIPISVLLFVSFCGATAAQDPDYASPIVRGEVLSEGILQGPVELINSGMEYFEDTCDDCGLNGQCACESYSDDCCGCEHCIKEKKIKWIPGHMPPPLPYKTTHMYYYFRPYNAINIPPQQAIAQEFGTDPALPYSNAIFESVYAEVESRISAGLPAEPTPASPADPTIAPPAEPMLPLE